MSASSQSGASSDSHDDVLASSGLSASPAAENVRQSTSPLGWKKCMYCRKAEFADDIDIEFSRRVYPDVEISEAWICKPCLRSVVEIGNLIQNSLATAIYKPIRYNIRRWVLKYLFKVECTSWSNAYQDARSHDSDEAKPSC